MKLNYLFQMLATVMIFILLGCSGDLTPSETLPPATQTGANTFGCLKDSKLWLPKGNVGTSNMSPSYDPNFNGQAIFDIAAYRILSDNDQQYLGIAVEGINNTGIHPVDGTSGNVYFSIKNGCDYLYSHDTTVHKKGTITITKLSLPIISGTFEFKIYKKGCGDTIKFTQGRFDIKL